MTLVAEGLGQHIQKGYIYLAIAFSGAVELLNKRLRKKSEPVHLQQQLLNEDILTVAPETGGR
jgi:predicted tellurium resistance membrane protein TerC